MKLSLQVLLIVAVMATVILFLLMFGFSDFNSMSSDNSQIWQTKPWRPYARLAMSFILISLTCILGGAFIRSIFRSRG